MRTRASDVSCRRSPRWLLVGVCLALAGWQEESTEWHVQFGSAQNDSCQGLAVDGEHLYAYGRANAALPDQAHLGEQDIYLRKLDLQGNTIWTRQFGTSGSDDSFWGNVEARGGRVIVAGGVTGQLPDQTHVGGLDAFIRAYDTDGNIVWTRQFGTTLHDAVRNVALDKRGDIYIAAQTNGDFPGHTNAGDRDAVIQKYDRDGNLIWTHQFGSTGFEEAIGVYVRGPFVYATGVTRAELPGQNTAGGTDGFVIKLSAEDGQVEWLRQFGSLGDDSPWKIRVIGRAIFASGHTSGSFGGPNAGATDPFLVRFDSDGDLQWVRQFGSPDVDFSFAMTVHEGGIVMAGSTRGAMPDQVHIGDADFYVRKFDKRGNELWTVQWGTTLLNALTAVAADGEDLYVAGATAGFLAGQTSAGAQDAVVIRLDLDQLEGDDDDEGEQEDD